MLPSQSPQALVSTTSPVVCEQEKPDTSEHDVVLKFPGADRSPHLPPGHPRRPDARGRLDCGEGRWWCPWAREGLEEAGVCAGDAPYHGEETRHAPTRWYALQSARNGRVFCDSALLSHHTTFGSHRGAPDYALHSSRYRPLCMNGTETWGRVHTVDGLRHIAPFFARVQKIAHGDISSRIKQLNEGCAQCAR
jgi:hypothetical protein